MSALTPRVDSIETGGTWKIGDVKHSFLTELEFQTEHDDSWILCNGEDVIGTDLAILKTGNAITSFNVPDARGQFLRGKNNGRSDGGGNPNTVLTGSINTTLSASVVGVGTLFLTELSIGDNILVGAETREISAISNNTNLTVTAAFSDQANDTSPEKVDNELALGTFQADAFQGHWHKRIYSTNRNVNSVFDTSLSNSAENNTDSNSVTDPISDGDHGDPRTSKETRPKNVTCNMFIKVNRNPTV